MTHKPLPTPPVPLIFLSLLSLHASSCERLLPASDSKNFLTNEVQPKIFSSLYKGLKNLSFHQAKELPKIKFPEITKFVELSPNERLLVADLLDRLREDWKESGIVDFRKCVELYEKVAAIVEGEGGCREREARAEEVLTADSQKIEGVLGFKVEVCFGFRAKVGLLC